MTASSETVTLRPAGPGDERALLRLAELDSRPLPAGPHLLVERAGVGVAAISLRTDELVADPFVRTAEVCELLRLQAARRRRPGRTGPFRRRPAVMPA